MRTLKEKHFFTGTDSGYFIITGGVDGGESGFATITQAGAVIYSGPTKDSKVYLDREKGSDIFVEFTVNTDNIAKGSEFGYFLTGLVPCSIEDFKRENPSSI